MIVFVKSVIKIFMNAKNVEMIILSKINNVFKNVQMVMDKLSLLNLKSVIVAKLQIV